MGLVPVPASEAKSLWDRYALACPPEELTASFDYPATFRFPLPTERIWTWHLGDREAAWGSLVVDAYGTSAATRVGVFPTYRNRGLWHKMVGVLRDQAFTDPDILAIRSQVLLTNPVHAARMLKLTQSTPWYRFDGLTLHPPTYHIITTRADWEAANDG